MNTVTDTKLKENEYQSRWDYLKSYKGLIGIIIIFELGLLVFLSSFSQPVKEVFGKPLIPIDLDNSDRSRVARIIMLYHALAVPFIAAISFFVMDYFKVREPYATQAKWAILVGAILTGIFGISFAYVLTDWTSHGIFILGLSISFYGGVLLMIGVWPTKNFPDLEENRGSMFRGINWEYFNLTLNIFALLFSTVLGAIAGSRFGNGFEAELAEDIVRDEHHDLYQRMIVSHLHIMVALMAAAVMILLIRHSGMKGRLFNICHMLTTPGIIIMSIGAWLVVPDLENAHMIINVGAMFLITVGIILAIYGFKITSQKILGDSYEDASLGTKIVSLKEDPVNLALYFQLIWVNLVVTAPGVYVAINLDKFRSDEYLEVERAFNTGHWHVLATLVAIMLLLLSVEYFEIKGKINKFIGWSMFWGSIIGFGFATLFMLRSPDSDGDNLFLILDIGVGLMFMATGFFGLKYLHNLYKKKNGYT